MAIKWTKARRKAHSEKLKALYAERRHAEWTADAAEKEADRRRRQAEMLEMMGMERLQTQPGKLIVLKVAPGGWARAVIEGTTIIVLSEKANG